MLSKPLESGGHRSTAIIAYSRWGNVQDDRVFAFVFVSFSAIPNKTAGD